MIVEVEVNELAKSAEYPRRIIVGIAAFNEEKTIARVVLEAQKHADVIVVCDDGSSDLTADTAKKLGADVVRHKKNLGKGMAFKSLFGKALELGADVVVTLDGDGQHDPSEIPYLVKPILDGEADIVVGSRFLAGKNEMPLYRWLGSRVLNGAVNMFGNGEKISDSQSGFRAYNRKVLTEIAIATEGIGVDSEILLKAYDNELRIKEVPVSCRFNGIEGSTYNPLRHGVNEVRSIIRYASEKRPLPIFGLPGTLVLALGLLFFIYVLQIYLSTSQFAIGYMITSMVAISIGAFGIFNAIKQNSLLNHLERIRRKDMTHRNLNVLLIGQNFPPESVGGAIHNLRLARYLYRLGCKVDVLTTYPTYPYGEFKRQNRFYSEEETENIKVMRVWTFQPTKPSPSASQRSLQYLIFPLHAFFRLMPILFFSRRRYDVVVTSHPPEPFLLLGYLIKKLTGVVWIAEFRDAWLEAAVSLGLMSERNIFYILSETIRRRALLSADIFAYVSKDIRDRFVKKYRIKGRQLFIPNGVDPAECPICEKKEKIIIYIGNIGYAYSLENVVKSLSYVADKDLKLLVVGGGDRKPDLLRLTSELGLEDRIKFVGILSHEETMNLTSKSLIGVHAQKELDFLKAARPIKIIEYMGCGIPFVAVGMGEIERLAKASEAGLVVKNEPLLIAKAIDSLIENNDLRNKMGLNGRKYAEKECNMPEMVSVMHKAMLDTLH